MKKILIFILTVSLFSCNTEVEEPATKTQAEKIEEPDLHSDKIEVLNFATFHMGATTDAKSVEFDEEDKKNQEDAKKLAGLLAAFNPTVICVEVPPKDNDVLNDEYQKYLKQPEIASSYYGEVGLIAFEIGRLKKLDRIYGIDHKLEYNYNLANEMKNEIDSSTVNDFQSDPFKSIPHLNIFEENISTFEKLRRMNDPVFLDFLITANADILTFVGSKEGFEGADEAAKYYQRNLRIYSNLNRIPLSKEDKVFILSGGSHTAFLKEFIDRSSKYKMVNTFDYLN